MKFLSPCLLSLLLTACGGQSKDTSPENDTTSNVNWGVLENINSVADIPEKLSTYNLFTNINNPTENPNGDAMPYDLTTALFTDYATKYRFIFTPPGTQIRYDNQEVLNFPIGTILVKTFSMPKEDTSKRGFSNEDMIETRLLVNTKNNGWLALPYAWNDEQTEAVFSPAGQSSQRTLTHKGESFTFDYQIPAIADCRKCHQLTSKIDGFDSSDFTPIGPKARLLNRDNLIDGEHINQLQHLIDQQKLIDAPSDLSSIVTTPSFNDSTDISAKTPTELEALAKGYLDINCAHCHRESKNSDGETILQGQAGYSGLVLEYWRSYEDNKVAHGECKTPVAYTAGGTGLAFDLQPGNASQSIIPYRMSLQTAKQMPEVGRDLIHSEGSALINAWIDSLENKICPTQ